MDANFVQHLILALFLYYLYLYVSKLFYYLRYGSLMIFTVAHASQSVSK